LGDGVLANAKISKGDLVITLSKEIATAFDVDEVQEGAVGGAAWRAAKVVDQLGF
jgi:hypothetical protein